MRQEGGRSSEGQVCASIGDDRWLDWWVEKSRSMQLDRITHLASSAVILMCIKLLVEAKIVPQMFTNT